MQETYVDNYNINKVHHYLMNTLKDEKVLNMYIKDSKNFLDMYNKPGKNIRKISFLNQKNKSEVDSGLIEIIEGYLNIARKYDNTIYIQRQIQNNITCLGCDLDIKNLECDEKGCILCPRCGVEQDDLRYAYANSEEQMKKISQIPITSVDYDSEENFIKAIHQFQGKSFKTRPQNMFAELDKYFEKNYPNLTQANAEKLPLDVFGVKVGTSLDIMCSALKYTGFEAWYDEFYSIARDYWGWRLPDIGKIENLLISDYRKTEKVYNSLQKDRKVALCRHWRLFKHLEMRGALVHIGMFKIMKMPEARSKHQDLWKKMTDGADDPDIFYIPSH